ncbi:MAG: hypothetical protein KF698_08155 [Anaerolineales bacterium]|nr:hypothetical protein [Anaerolineales bacterium]
MTDHNVADIPGSATGTLNGLIIGWTQETEPRLYVMGELAQVQLLFPAGVRADLLEVNGESALVATYSPELDAHIRHLVDTLIQLREQHPRLMQLTLIDEAVQ